MVEQYDQKNLDPWMESRATSLPEMLTLDGYIKVKWALFFFLRPLTWLELFAVALPKLTQILVSVYLEIIWL